MTPTLPAAEKIARDLLPCELDCNDPMNANHEAREKHFEHCPAHYRPQVAQVAAALMAERDSARDEVARLREALETKGLADIWRDGFEAALDSARSIKILVGGQPIMVSQAEVVRTLEANLAKLKTPERAVGEARKYAQDWCEACGGEGKNYTSRYGGNDPDVWPIGECEVCAGTGRQEPPNPTLNEPHESLADELVPIKNDQESFGRRCWDNRDLIIRALRGTQGTEIDELREPSEVEINAAADEIAKFWNAAQQLIEKGEQVSVSLHGVARYVLIAAKAAQQPGGA